MEFLKHILLAVAGGGIAASACSPAPPISILESPSACIWNQSGGNASRSAYSESVAAAGKFSLLWNRRLKAPATVEPTIEMGAIFIPATDKSIYVASLEDGRQLGSISFSEPVTTPCAVSDSLIVINEFGKIMSVINWVDRRKVWAVDLYGVETEPLLYNGLLYWQDGKGILHCFSLDEGKRVWEKPLDFEAVVAPAACSAGLALVDVTGGIHFLSYDGGGQLWSLETGARIRNSPLLTGDYLYYSTVDGKLGRINILDGLKSWETALESRFIAPPACDGDAVFLGTNSGMLIRINTQDGSRGWQLQLGGPISAGISIAGEFIIAADLNHSVYIVDKHNGAIRFEHETEGMISARPVVCGNRIYVVGEDKNLYCLRISDEE